LGLSHPMLLIDYTLTLMASAVDAFKKSNSFIQEAAKCRALYRPQ